MHGGRLEQCAPPSELYDTPATPFVAEFVGTMNRIPGRTGADGTVEVLGRRLPLRGRAQPATGTDVDALVRPEALDVAVGGDARVVTASFHGAVTRLALTLADGTTLKADVPSHRAAELPAGAQVTVGLPDRPVLVDDRAR
jgi:putative spermidine/putrescine transport system ATP-binding protein